MSELRHFLSLDQFDGDTLRKLLARADEHRLGGTDMRMLSSLERKLLAMIFTKASTRTRVSFEAAILQLGGHAITLTEKDSQIGRGEPIEDTARVLSGYVDAMMIRTGSHDTLLKLAEHSSVPVINGLTDFNHPCQILADLLTCKMAFPSLDYRDLRVAWIGDGNNVLRSWVHAAQILGFQLRIASPSGYALEASEHAINSINAGAVTFHTHPRVAVESANVVTTDVWASMGQEQERQERLNAFQGYQVDEALMACAETSAIFLHCLPAHRGEEVSSSVIDRPDSLVWSEAHNRLHAQKAVLEWCFSVI